MNLEELNKKLSFNLDRQDKLNKELEEKKIEYKSKVDNLNSELSELENGRLGEIEKQIQDLEQQKETQKKEYQEYLEFIDSPESLEIDSSEKQENIKEFKSQLRSTINDKKNLTYGEEYKTLQKQREDIKNKIKEENKSFSSVNSKYQKDLDVVGYKIVENKVDIKMEERKSRSEEEYNSLNEIYKFQKEQISFFKKKLELLEKQQIENQKQNENKISKLENRVDILEHDSEKLISLLKEHNINIDIENVSEETLVKLLEKEIPHIKSEIEEKEVYLTEQEHVLRKKHLEKEKIKNGIEKDNLKLLEKEIKEITKEESLRNNKQRILNQTYQQVKNREVCTHDSYIGFSDRLNQLIHKYNELVMDLNFYLEYYEPETEQEKQHKNEIEEQIREIDEFITKTVEERKELETQNSRHGKDYDEKMDYSDITYTPKM